MKGKIVLLPLKEPKEGMKVVWGDKVLLLNGQENKKHPGYQPDYWLVGDKFTNISYEPLHVFQQIAVEYKVENQKYLVKRPSHLQHMNDVYKSLPLHPDDYEKALPLIGKDVEFEDIPICENCGGEYCDNGNCKGVPDWHLAKLITPTPVMYTEEEAFQLLLKFRIDKCKEICYRPAVIDWWNQNKKK